AARISRRPRRPSARSGPPRSHRGRRSRGEDAAMPKANDREPMDSAPLLGVRAVVTGSTRGFGEAVARDLAPLGAKVVVNGTDGVRCEAVAAEIDGVAVAGSVADEALADRIVAASVEAHGGLDLLVNNAGISRDG